MKKGKHRIDNGWSNAKGTKLNWYYQGGGKGKEKKLALKVNLGSKNETLLKDGGGEFSIRPYTKPLLLVQSGNLEKRTERDISLQKGSGSSGYKGGEEGRMGVPDRHSPSKAGFNWGKIIQLNRT